MGDWKLIQGSAGQWNDWYPVPSIDNDYHVTPDDESMQPTPAEFQLYNIRDDPTERNDLAENNPEVLAKMKARLEEWRKTLVPANMPPDDPAANPKNFDYFRYYYYHCFYCCYDYYYHYFCYCCWLLRLLLLLDNY
nr:hypothetical protein BaRGS_033539 [Batillaria attramentaria]